MRPLVWLLGALGLAACVSAPEGPAPVARAALPGNSTGSPAGTGGGSGAKSPAASSAPRG